MNKTVEAVKKGAESKNRRIFWGGECICANYTQLENTKPRQRYVNTGK